MRMEIENARKTIYSYVENNSLLSTYSFNNVAHLLTCAFENINIELLSPEYMTAYKYIDDSQAKYRDGYRESLKDAFKYCKEKETNGIPKDYEINRCKALIEQEILFNPIRYSFERFDVGYYDLHIEGKNIEFNYKNCRRAKDVELILKYNDIECIDKARPKFDEARYKEIIKYMCLPDFTNKWDSYKQLSKSRQHFKTVVDAAYNKIKQDASEKSDYDFGRFELSDFQRVYAVIMALGICCFNYHYTLRHNIKNNKFYNNYLEEERFCPIVKKKKWDLVEIIKEYTQVDNTAIDEILHYLIYDPCYQANSIGIFQPLFEDGDMIYYSPSLVTFAFAQDKFIWVLRKSGMFEPQIAQIAKEHEKLMVDLLNCQLKGVQLLKHSNYRAFENGIIKAEYDYMIYDEIKNKILLVELKWFYKGDSAKDFRNVDLKIQDEIDKRNLRQTYFESNYKKIIKETFKIEPKKKPETMSCIVSQNHLGSSWLEDNLAVFDEATFLWFMKKHNYDMDLIFKKLKEKDYLPDEESLGLKKCPQVIEYAGYRIVVPGICRKGVVGE